MTSDPKNKPHSYVPDVGITVVKETPAPDRRVTINLSLNESSYGASPLAQAAAGQRCLSLNRYPDPMSTELRAAIGRCHDLDPDQITCGNGSEELLDIVGRLFARPGDEIVYSKYAFVQFPIVAMRVGAEAVVVGEQDMTTDVDQLLAGVTERTKIVFVANPNNPTGTYIPASELKRLHAGLPGSVVLVIDAAYAEFVEDGAYSSGMELVAGNDNVIVTRTFSKAFGLAALRVGWAFSSKDMAALINRMRGIGNINAVAQAAAVAALEDLEFVARVRARTAIERAYVTEALTGLGLEVAPSAANFVIAKFPSDTNHTADAAFAHLAGRGVLVRTVEDYGLDDYLRITLGSRAENDALIGALKDFLV